MVEKSNPAVVWNKRAYISLQKAYKTIKEDSLQNAQMVRDEILRITREELPANPEKYPPDKFKKNNQGNYRAFERSSYRISYRYTPKEVRILRLRHVKQEPKQY
jgi:plasmid stabilization system protein ParE